MADLLSQTPIAAGQLLSDFEESVEGAGAVVSFSGLVRGEANGETVKTLSLQAYSPLTENGISEAITEAKARWPLDSVKVVHRIGDMVPGDLIVFVAVASAHRRAAFEAADFLMDYLKTQAIFWKKESRASGDTWIEPRSEDYADAQRWKKDM